MRWGATCKLDMKCVCSSRLRILISIWPNECFQGVKCILMMMSVSGAELLRGLISVLSGLG